MKEFLQWTAVVWAPVALGAAAVTAAPFVGVGAFTAGFAGASAGLLLGGIETARIFGQAAENPMTRIETATNMARFVANGFSGVVKNAPSGALGYLFNREARKEYTAQKKVLREADKKLRKFEKQSLVSAETHQARREYLDVLSRQKKFTQILKDHKK